MSSSQPILSESSYDLSNVQTSVPVTEEITINDNCMNKEDLSLVENLEKKINEMQRELNQLKQKKHAP